MVSHGGKRRSRLALLAAGGLIAATTGGMAQNGGGQAAPDNAAPDTRPIRVTLNGDPVVFTNIPPQQIAGRVLVPVRGVLEKLGATLAWIPKTQTVVASTPTLDVQLVVGNRHATVNARDVLLDVPAQQIAGSTLVPLRFLGEALGAKLTWDGITRTVTITTSDFHPKPILAAPSPVIAPAPTRKLAPNSPAPIIESFTDDAQGWLRAGQTLHVTLNGTPGGRAVFHIPGLADNVPLREAAPGRYSGVWQVPDAPGLHLTNAAVVGSLEIGARRATELQAAGLVQVDTNAPELRDRAPEPNAQVNALQPNISAVFEDRGSGIDPLTIRLLVNSRDVTRQATITRNFLSYTPDTPLPPGEQTVEVSVANKAGNRARSVWRFIEMGRVPGGIRSVVNSAGQPLQAGDTFRVELTGTPGGAASFSAGSLRDVALPEIAPGRYRADYTVRRADSAAQARVTARLLAGGSRFVQDATQTLTIRTGRLPAPVITFPGPNDAPVSPLVIRGRGAANTRIHVRVDYRSREVGRFVLQGTAVDTVVGVDRGGLWQTAPINIMGLFRNRGIQYTLSATDLDVAGEPSDAATLTFRLN